MVKSIHLNVFNYKYTNTKLLVYKKDEMSLMKKLKRALCTQKVTHTQLKPLKVNKVSSSIQQTQKKQPFFIQFYVKH